MAQDIQTTLMWVKNNMREVEQNRQRMVTYLEDNGFFGHDTSPLGLLIHLCEETIKVKGAKK